MPNRIAHGTAHPSSGSSSPERPEDVARTVMLRRLAMGPRTRSQLYEAALARGVTPAVADAVLDRFTEVGLVDDADFAREWVRVRHRDKGLSRRALADEMRRKGVPSEDAEAALATLGEDEERAAAEDLVVRALPRSRGLDHPKRVNRLVGMLARKGYGSGLAAEVVRAALVGESPDDEP